MEVFPRPDIAEGIFYEYLRYDDPISPDLREHVVDGFPFLLAPLSQMPGVHIGGEQKQQASSTIWDNRIFHAMSHLVNLASSQASEAATMVQKGAFDAATNTGNAAKSMADSAFQLGKELDRRRDLLFKHAAALPSTAAKVPHSIISFLSSVTSRGDQNPIQIVTEWVAANITPMASSEQTQPHQQELTVRHQQSRRESSLGRAFGYPLSQWFSETYQAPDEIGLKIAPNMSMTRKIFLAFVHVYLLLILIVSFPGSHTTRTKFRVRKKSKELCDNSPSLSRASSTIASEDYSETETAWCGDASFVIENKVEVDAVEHPASISTNASGSLEQQRDAVSQCLQGELSSRNILSRARKALRPSASEEIQEASVRPANGRLKKKSLSYFL